MLGSSRWFQTLTTSASARRRSMRKSERTLGSTAFTDLARKACAFSSGARLIPRHWARMRSRDVILPGPRGGMWRGGGENIFPKEANGLIELNKLNELNESL